MAQGPKDFPPPPGTGLEDLVYRSTLAEDDRALRGASPWLTLPVTLAVAGAFGGLAFVLGRQTETGRKVLESVAVVLQEGPDAPVRAAAPAPAAAPKPTPAQAPAAAPAPVVPPKEPPPPPPDPRQEAAPDAAPRALPKEDLSRQYGSNAVAAGGSGGGSGPAGAGGAGGSGAGRAPGQVMDVEFSQIKIKYRPPIPEYPGLARASRIQGTVVVEILVDSSGVPISARALSGPFSLRATAVAYSLTWRFFPLVVNGVPQATRFTLNMPFQLT
jgi:protein TonB